MLRRKHKPMRRTQTTQLGQIATTARRQKTAATNHFAQAASPLISATRRVRPRRASTTATGTTTTVDRVATVDTATRGMTIAAMVTMATAALGATTVATADRAARIRIRARSEATAITRIRKTSAGTAKGGTVT